MATRKSRNTHPEDVQLALNLPGFDFTPPQKTGDDNNDSKVMPQVTTTVAGQLRLKLDR